MNRRGFLGALAATAAAFALDPERALWVPGATTISIPKPTPVQYRCLLFNPAIQPLNVRNLFNPPLSYEDFQRLVAASAEAYRVNSRDFIEISLSPA